MFGKIIGTGSYAPDNVVCNNDLKEFFETDDQWIRERTGIKRRPMRVQVIWRAGRQKRQ